MCDTVGGGGAEETVCVGKGEGVEPEETVCDGKGEVSQRKLCVKGRVSQGKLCVWKEG